MGGPEVSFRRTDNLQDLFDRVSFPRSANLGMAKQGLHIYFGRMKIEESFKDLKDLLGMTKLMNQKQEYMEKMIALLLLIFPIGLLLGQELRDLLYGEPIAADEQTPKKEPIPGTLRQKKGKKWKRYSGSFILLRQKWVLSDEPKHYLPDCLALFYCLGSIPCPNLSPYLSSTRNKQAIQSDYNS